jgi:hypothetical protein
VRQLIAVAVQAEAGDRHLANDLGLARPEVREQRSRIEIRLTVGELRAVEGHALASGLNCNRWIVALVRAKLTREPQLGERELCVLASSNQQLAAINRLLGLLVRNDEVGLIGQDLAEVQDVREQIHTHLQAVAAVMRVNLDRWSR